MNDDKMENLVGCMTALLNQRHEPEMRRTISNVGPGPSREPRRRGGRNNSWRSRSRSRSEAENYDRREFEFKTHRPKKYEGFQRMDSNDTSRGRNFHRDYRRPQRSRGSSHSCDANFGGRSSNQVRNNGNPATVGFHQNVAAFSQNKPLKTNYQKEDFRKPTGKYATLGTVLTNNFPDTSSMKRKKCQPGNFDSSDSEFVSSIHLNDGLGANKPSAQVYENRHNSRRFKSNHYNQGYLNRSASANDEDGKSDFIERGKVKTDEIPPRRNYKKNKPVYVISDGSTRNQNNPEESKPGVRTIFVGFKYLKEQSEKETAVIVSELLNPDSPLHLFLEKREHQAEWLFLIVSIVTKICSSEFVDTRNEIINKICRSTFLHAVSHYLGEVSIETRQTTIEKLPSFIRDLIAFYTSVINFLPTVAVDCDIFKLIAKTKKTVESMNSDHNLNVDENLFRELNVLGEKLDDYKKLLEKPPKPIQKRSYLQFISQQPPPDNFRDLDLYPTYEDLTRRSFGFVRPNKIKGAYDDEEHYLDVQFRLLREDFIDPLRQGLNKYLEAKASAGKVRLKYKYESLRLYPKCAFLEVIKNDKNQPAYVLNFDPNKKMRIKWEYSKRFMFGSLLLFTNDNFSTFFYGTVAGRDTKLLTEGNILVSFPYDVQADQNLLSKEFLMAESEVFFEPYFLVMKSLKMLNAENFPMKKYVVEGKSDTDYPAYLYQDILWDILGFSEVNPFEIEYWPTATELGLDPHQNRAFQKALTSEFCVIQGPPGTGKTFIGLKIVQVLLQNIKLNKDKIRSPMLIVCYTNHALDQFLEGIMKCTQKIIRVGSQSKSELLKDFNLRGRKQWHIRQSPAVLNLLAPALKKIKEDVKKNSDEISGLMGRKSSLEEPVGILRHDILRTVMTDEQKQKLTNCQSLLHWLLENGDDSNYSRDAMMTMSQRKLNDPNSRTTGSEAMMEEEEAPQESDEESEEDYHMVDEDDIFELDSTAKASLNSDSPYAITADEIAEEVKNLFGRFQWLGDLEDEQIEDFAEHYNRLQSLEVLVRTVASRHEILTEQLTNFNYSAEKVRLILAKDLDRLSVSERWTLYWSWVKVLRENVIQELQKAEEKYRNSMAQYEDVKQIEDLFVVQQADVVGMTTTCAARMHKLLNSLKPAIVVVEEAAEVLESHIVTSLTKSCQHVILIGDHKQLKPSSAVYNLSTNYNIDVSLFERMINNGMDCPILNVQHRMRPEIASLITPLIYEHLKNDQSVFAFENIKGMTKNLYFLEHNHHEQDVEDTSSRKNPFEAEFLIELCTYLVLQGYDPEKITMLTTYAGQMFLLREKKRQRQLIQHVKCIVVDKYQGEENDIILLSLVRSNEEAKIGFLKTENRVCVALSRARKGFYIIGNMNILAKSSPNLWGNIAENLRKQNAIGKELRLFCSRHEIHTDVSCVNDFDKVREGGCSNICGELLECGHNCQRLCHPLDREHKEIRCREPCQKRCIREKHECKKLCFEDCGQCKEKVDWKLDCGHSKTLYCHVNEREYLCEVIVDDVSPLCKHAVKRKCYEMPEDVACPHPCEDRLECGHACVNKCHKKHDPDHVDYKCRKPCGKLNKKCANEHACQKSCFEECGQCTIKVVFTLGCGHTMKLPCSTQIYKVKCFEKCKKKCPECKQNCRKLCHEDCSPCKNVTKKVVPECGHKVTLECNIQPERRHCIEKCERLLTCAHKCRAKCSQTCGSVECTELVQVMGVQSLCGHGFVKVPCFRNRGQFDEETLRDFLQFCDAPCDKLLKCGDPCSSTCGKCWQGRLHELCQKDCGSVGICGHSCKYPCRQMCPPCEESCSYRCKHSRCPKKCGVPCVQCKEPCEWKCPHEKCTKKCGQICDREPCLVPCRMTLECGHPCIGFCGEPCPPECRICNPEITEIMFGYEDEENARFVFLVDCKHTVESQALDMHLNATPQGGEIVMKVCPLCKTPITQTLRYMNYVKNTYSNILKVKEKIFGTTKTIREKRKELQECLAQFITSSDQNVRMTGLKKMRGMADEYYRKVNLSTKKKNTISVAELNTIEFFYRVLVDIDSRLESLLENNARQQQQLHEGSATKNVVKYVKSLLVRMCAPAIQVNEQLSDDLSLELRRYHKMVDYSLVLRNQGYLFKKNDPIVIRPIQRLVTLIFGSERFADRVEDEVTKIFKDLEEALKIDVPLTSEEKRMLNQAMSSSFYGGTGHWFTCSNGHPYVITECGGAMQKSKCPECGEVIGGEDHRYVETAILASDFDGARNAAWGPVNDMRNFQL